MVWFQQLLESSTEFQRLLLKMQISNKEISVSSFPLRTFLPRITRTPSAPGDKGMEVLSREIRGNLSAGLAVTV